LRHLTRLTVPARQPATGRERVIAAGEVVE